MRTRIAFTLLLALVSLPAAAKHGLTPTERKLVSRVEAREPQALALLERIVNVIFDEIVSALSRGDRVELRGFGAFTVKYRAARQGRNPRTGAPVPVDEKYVPFFKTGKELRERLNRPS